MTGHRSVLSQTFRCLLHTVRGLSLGVFLLLTAHCSLLTGYGQSATATLSGTVADQNGAVIPNVSVSVADPAKGIKRQATTNEQGSFTVPLLPPSTYTVTVENHGFAPVQIQNVFLNVGDQKALQIQLKAGDVNATVQVTSEAPLIDESPAVSTVVDSQFVENLPLNGRTFQTLINLTPGVVATVAGITEQGQFSVNGQRPDANYFTVDGVSANSAASPSFNTLAQSASGSVPNLSVTGGTNSLVSVDAMQEFRIQTSTYAPEFGRSPGAQISIVTRSGANQFHGTLFDFLRNDKLDANDWFANSVGLPKPRERQNDFGGTFSGPILLPRFGEGGKQPGYNGRKRTFFFFSYEGLRLRLPHTGLTTVPSISTRQSAPASIQPFLNLFPIPNGPDLGNGQARFNATFSDKSNVNSYSIRLDHSISNKVSLFGRYSYASSDLSQRGSAGTFSLNTIGLTENSSQSLTVGTTLALRNSLTNDFRFNYSRNTAGQRYQLDTFGGAVVPPDATLSMGPFSGADSGFALTMLAGTQLRYREGTISGNTQRQLNVVDSLSLQRNNHSIKLGLD